jgi:hypothetical protein
MMVRSLAAAAAAAVAALAAFPMAHFALLHSVIDSIREKHASCVAAACSRRAPPNTNLSCKLAAFPSTQYCEETAHIYIITRPDAPCCRRKDAERASELSSADKIAFYVTRLFANGGRERLKRIETTLQAEFSL